MRTGTKKNASTLRLFAAAILACLLVPVAAGTAAPNTGSSVSSVSIQIPANTSGAWTKPPLIADLIPQGPGVMYYRFGAGPGPWQQCIGPVLVPPGKQLMSAVLIAPDGTPGTVTTIVTRSDIHALTLADTSPALVSSSTVTYSGVPQTAGSVTVSVLIGRQLGTIVRRLGGQDRYDTGAIISSSVPTHGNTVIIATGQKFPDALTASGLAGCLNAPVLLVTRDYIPPTTSAEIKRLGVHHAIIVGGTPSVSAGVASKLKGMGLSVERLAGKTRYETAVAISQRVQKLTGSHSRVYIARGDQFADALIVAPLAYATRAPILLTTNDRLHDSTAARLTAAKYAYATIVGGAPSPRAEGGVRNRIGTVDRWAGVDPSDTSVQVASASVLGGALSWKYVGVARSDIFPDALCGGALAGKQGGVILLTPSTVLDPGVANAMTAHTADVKRCEIFGATTAVSQAVFDQIRAIFH